MFDFNEIKEGRRFVGFGINHSVTIVSVENGTSTNGVPFIQLNVKLTGDEDKNSTILKLYMSPKATNISMRKLMHINSAVGKIETLKKGKYEGIEDLALGLNHLWSDKKFRLKLFAEEYAGQDKDGNPKTKIRTTIPFTDFAEAIDPGADMHPIKDEDTQMRFSKKNPDDYKRLIEDDEVVETKSNKSDLPF